MPLGVAIGAVAGAAAGLTGGVILGAKLGAAIERAKAHSQLANIDDTSENLQKYNAALKTQLELLKLDPTLSNAIMEDCGIREPKRNGLVYPICLEMYNDFLNQAHDGWFDELVDEAHGYYKEIMLGILLYLRSQNVIQYDGDSSRYTLKPGKLSQGSATMLMFGNTLAVFLDQYAKVIKSVPDTPEKLATKKKEIEEWGSKISYFITQSFQDSSGLLSVHRTRFGSFLKEMIGLANRRQLAMSGLVDSIQEAEVASSSGEVKVLSPIQAITRALIAKAELDYAKAQSVELLKSGLTFYNRGFETLMSATQTEGDSKETGPATDAHLYRTEKTVRSNKARNVWTVGDLEDNKAFVKYIQDCFDASGAITSFQSPLKAQFQRIGATKGTTVLKKPSAASCGAVPETDAQSSMELTLSKVILEKVICMLMAGYDKEVSVDRAQSPLAYYFLKQIELGLTHLQHLQSRIAALPLEKELIKRSNHYYEKQNTPTYKNTNVTLAVSEELSSTRGTVDIARELDDPYQVKSIQKSAIGTGSGSHGTDTMLQTICAATGSTFCTLKRQELGWQVRSKNLVNQLLRSFDIRAELSSENLSNFELDDPRAKALTMLAALGSSSSSLTSDSNSVKQVAKGWFEKNDSWISGLVGQDDAKAAVLVIADQQEKLRNTMATILKEGNALITLLNGFLVEMAKDKKSNPVDQLNAFKNSPYISYVRGDKAKPAHFVMHEEKMITLFSFHSVVESLSALANKFPSIEEITKNKVQALIRAADTLPTQSLDKLTQGKRKAIQSELSSRFQLDSENRVLRTELDDRNQAVAKLESTLAKVREQSDELTEHVTDLESKLTGNIDALTNLTTELSQVKQGLAEATQKADKTTSDYNTLTTDVLQELKKQQEGWIAETKLIQSQFEDKQKTFQKQHEDLLQKVAQSSRSDEGKQELIELCITHFNQNNEQTRKEVEANHARMSGRAQALSQRILAYESQKTNLSEDAKGLLSALKQAEYSVSQLLNEMTVFKQTLTQLVKTEVIKLQRQLDEIKALVVSGSSQQASSSDPDSDLGWADNDQEIQNRVHYSKTVTAALEFKKQAINVKLTDLNTALKKLKLSTSTSTSTSKSTDPFADSVRVPAKIEVMNALVAVFAIANVHRRKGAMSANLSKSAQSLAEVILPTDRVKKLALIDLLQAHVGLLSTTVEKSSDALIQNMKTPKAFKYIKGLNIFAMVEPKGKHEFTPAKFAKVMKAILTYQYSLFHGGNQPSLVDGYKKSSKEEWISFTNDFAMALPSKNNTNDAQRSEITTKDIVVKQTTRTDASGDQEDDDHEPFRPMSPH